MIQNPILKVLSTLSCHGVKHLLMGGQACVFYGAAEFSRDCDVVVLATDDNLHHLTAALAELQAECIAVPPRDWTTLERGHAIHFRCHHPDAVGIRLDVMSKMRGCDDFGELWQRRTTIQVADGFDYELLGIEDLVRAKKTQRDKDWPMIRRLVDAHYDRHQDTPTPQRNRFWLRECRTPEILVRLAAENPDAANELALERPLLLAAVQGDRQTLECELEAERLSEMEADKQYWTPLRKELEAMRRDKRNRDGG
ncbi:MAG: hypothetical protein KDA47_10320 [Planctomycetales bacterium]|nr:hypothetical protein [Planctomycetales bacterium]